MINVCKGFFFYRIIENSFFDLFNIKKLINDLERGIIWNVRSVEVRMLPLLSEAIVGLMVAWHALF